MTLVKQTMADQMTKTKHAHPSLQSYKASEARLVYLGFKGIKRVLDPCAGWGGRMLGAHMLDLDYTGIDSNKDLKPGYDKLFREIGRVYPMIWQDCLTVDFPKVDLVFTSPPWGYTEVYPHMPLYDDFANKLWEKASRPLALHIPWEKYKLPPPDDMIRPNVWVWS